MTIAKSFLNNGSFRVDFPVEPQMMRHPVMLKKVGAPLGSFVIGHVVCEDETLDEWCTVNGYHILRAYTPRVARPEERTDLFLQRGRALQPC